MTGKRGKARVRKEKGREGERGGERERERLREREREGGSLKQVTSQSATEGMLSS